MEDAGGAPPASRIPMFVFRPPPDGRGLGENAGDRKFEHDG
jgi:hypothetical protein